MNGPTLLHSIPSEQALLGALMLDGQAFDRIDAPLTPAMFCADGHAHIYATIQHLHAENKPHDAISVADALEETGLLHAAGGLAYVAGLAAEVASSANARNYAEIVAERALRRAAAVAADEIAQAAAAPGKSAQEVIEFAQSKVMALGQQTGRFAPVPAARLLSGACQRLQDRCDGKAEPGMPTGFPDLDKRMNGGLRAGQLVILAARPSMGKTALAMQISTHAALSGQPVLFCSQEMAEGELMDRTLAQHGRIPLDRVLSGQMFREDWDRITAATCELHRSALWIDEQPALTLMSVRQKARRVAREQGRLGMLVVDYLQLMVGEGANRNAEIEQISRGLKQLAKEMGMPVIALSQLSRDCEKRPNKRPMASDLRDSGAIEQDADVILTLYRDEIYNPDSPEKGLAELGVIKCRNGRSGGFVPLVFKAEMARFDSMQQGAWPQRDETRPFKRRGFDS